MHIFLASLPPGVSSSDVCFLVSFTDCFCLWIMALVQTLISQFQMADSHISLAFSGGVRFMSIRLSQSATCTEKDCIHPVLTFDSALFGCPPS